MEEEVAMFCPVKMTQDHPKIMLLLSQKELIRQV
jgi:hypothetical protein